MELFNYYQEINDLQEIGEELKARNELIKVLDMHEKQDIKYNHVINHLIRRSGLFPYIQIENASWEDRYIYEAFKVNIGKSEPAILHYEQSRILKKLLNGDSFAVSAPTSFGKSFIIDSFIAIKKPENVVIIVPTIALTDETRRRLQRKFSDEYKIITNTDIQLSTKNIFIFPQERANNYVDKLSSIDLLIIDEFYKASLAFDSERAPALVRAIIKLGKISKQKYFLAPNISKLNKNPVTKDMEFVHLDYNTVFLRVFTLYKEIKKDEEKKGLYLLKILDKYTGKTLIYAGTYTNIDKVSTLIIDKHLDSGSELLANFEKWLIKNYDPNWILPKLVKRGAGIHNGRLHRSLSQIQIHLFEQVNGLNCIISTSSIIEGVNTSAENVIIWKNKNGTSGINDFTYKNIIGRSGRMFRHFIGNVFVLESPPDEEQTELDLEVPNEIINEIDEDIQSEYLKEEQVRKAVEYKDEMISMLGAERYKILKKEKIIQSSDSELILSIVQEIFEDQESWRRLSYLNSPDPDQWDTMLYKVINLDPGNWGTRYSYFVGFIKALSNNWDSTIPDLLRSVEYMDLGINEIFQLERTLAFEFSSLLQDVNTIQKIIINEPSIDISPFIFRISHAFLPKNVYQLEEYGLPRMISKKIHEAGLIDLENGEIEINTIIETFKKLGSGRIKSIKSLDNFDNYVVDYFYEGIIINKN
ncbi:DEAD/DEAH box helicase [Spirochaeta lutea]|uniref:Helicase n=1 Tax=Spirochaeta lutea TaxID=1480694 RepID=A0A098R1W9_9SPIO|nr:DEAD/DEAH box helicase [Spirochaeta lutea]KGE73663.1 hypothetical protein DC28_01570 [Spirochaeta lutea]